MAVEALLERARTLGITLGMKDDLLTYLPKSKAPPEFVEDLRLYRREVIDYIARGRYSI